MLFVVLRGYGPIYAISSNCVLSYSPNHTFDIFFLLFVFFFSPSSTKLDNAHVEPLRVYWWSIEDRNLPRRCWSFLRPDCKPTRAATKTRPICCRKTKTHKQPFPAEVCAFTWGVFPGMAGREESLGSGACVARAQTCRSWSARTPR